MADESNSVATDSPYFCDPKDLPAPLPTLEEIEATETTLPCIWSPDEKRIVVVRGVFVVKYGIPPWVNKNEGHALRVLKGVPLVPKLYAMYSHESKNYLVMEFLPGKSLEEIWDTLSEDDKVAVTQQLHDTLARVRSIPPPSPPMLGNITGGPVPHQFFNALIEDRKISGPFATEADFHNGIALHLKEDLAGSNRPDLTADFLERHLASAMTSGHACVLTHGDLQLKNILIDRRSTRQVDDAEQSAQSSAIRVTGIVDWESAGWMPSYWEYACLFMTADWGSDWIIKFEHVVDAWPAEGAMLKFVYRSFMGF